jgi:dCMP deaminase
MVGVILDRTTKEEWFLDVALDCAMRSTCLRRKYGAIIVDENDYIISTGYNGAPRGVTDCLDLKSCWREAMNIPSGQFYEKCMSVHAEMNALLQAGKAARRGTMYLSGYDVKTQNIPDNMIPCSLCTKLLINSQIRNVVMMDEDIVDYKYKIMTPLQIWKIREKEILSPC